MTFEIALVFLITAGALYLFASERLPLDVTALLILVTVMAVPLLGHSHGSWNAESTCGPPSRRFRRGSRGSPARRR